MWLVAESCAAEGPEGPRRSHAAAVAGRPVVNAWCFGVSPPYYKQCGRCGEAFRIPRHGRRCPHRCKSHGRCCGYHMVDFSIPDIRLCALLAACKCSRALPFQIAVLRRGPIFCLHTRANTTTSCSNRVCIPIMCLFGNHRRSHATPWRQSRCDCFSGEYHGMPIFCPCWRRS